MSLSYYNEEDTLIPVEGFRRKHRDNVRIPEIYECPSCRELIPVEGYDNVVEDCNHCGTLLHFASIWEHVGNECVPLKRPQFGIPIPTEMPLAGPAGRTSQPPLDIYVLMRFAGPFHDLDKNSFAVGKRTKAGYWISGIWAQNVAHSEPVEWWPLPGECA